MAALQRNYTPASGSRLDALLAQYNPAKQAADESAAHLAEIKDGIKAELLALADAGELVLDRKVVLPHVAFAPRTSWRLDTTAFKRDHADMYARYAKQSTTWELRGL